MVYLIRTNSIGDTLWTKTYGDSSQITVGHFVQQVSDGGFIIAGESYFYFRNSYPYETLTDVYLIRTDSKGDTLWTKIYGGVKQDYGRSVQQTNDGGFIIGGYTSSFCVGVGKHDIYVIRTDSIGDTLWAKTYGGPYDEHGTSVQQTFDGGFIVLGMIHDSAGIMADIYVIRTNLDGDTLWTKTYGGDKTEEGLSIQQTSDGGFIIGGGTNSFSGNDYDVYLIRTDINGDTLWTRTYGGDFYDYGRSVQQTSDSGFIIAGNTTSFGTGGSDVYLIRLDKETVGIQQDHPSNPLNPNNFTVSYNNNLISIRYTIPYSSPVNLSMYNIAGQLVKTIFNEYKNAGDYTVNVKTGENSAGVYYFKITTGKKAYTKKVVVVK